MNQTKGGNREKDFKPDQVFTPYNIVKRVILPYWPIYILSFVIAYIASKYYLQQQPFIYEVYGKVLIKPELSSGKGQQVLEDLDMFASAKIVENELEIIQSRMLCAEVGKAINSYVRYYSATDKKSPELDWDFPIQFEAVNEDSLKGSGGFGTLIIGSQKKNMRINGEIYEIKDQTIKMGQEYYKVRILKDKLTDIIPGVYKFFINSIENEVNTLINSVTPAPTGKGTTIIGIRYRGYNIRNNRRILNEFISQYTSAGVEDKRSVAQYTMDFIEDRLRLISGELDSVETNIERFKQKTGLISVDQQASLYLNKLMDRDMELGKIGLKLDILKSIEQYLFNKKNNPGMVPSLVDISDPLLSTLLTKLYELEFQYDRRLKISGQGDESLISMAEEIKDIKQGIFENIKNIRSNLQVNKQKLESELERSEAELKEIPTQEKRLIDISRQQAVKNEIFSYLLEKREESAISFASTVSDVRIIERAYGGSTLSPKPHLTYGLMFSLAISIPLIFFFWRVMLNPRIQFRDEIESLLNIPILGDLMFDEKKRTIVTSAKDRGQLAESLRTIRTKLTYFQTVSDHKVLMVSSSIPGEGKSFISVNLGLSYSLINNKVVLVGGDLRKPALHKIFDMSMKKGLSSYLNGTSALDEVVYATEFDNLWILPSGAIPPNPSELLESEKMSKLMEELREKFDIVVIDTPPLGLVADAEIIARHCDIHMFVIRYNYTPKEAVEQVLEKAKSTGLFSQFSIIFNGVKPKGLGKYGYYYGYAYNYGGYSSYGGYGYYGSTRKRTGISYLVKKLLKFNK